MKHLFLILAALVITGCSEREYEVHAPYCKYAEKITFSYESEIDGLVNSTAEKILNHNNNVCRMCGKC